jgi:hypothetical protein
MTRKLAKTVTRTEGDEDTADAMPDDIVAIFATIPSDATIDIMRRGDDSKQMEYCGTMAPDEFSLEEIRKVFGGGLYVAKARWTHPTTGLRGYGTQKQFRVAGLPTWKGSAVAGPLAAPQSDRERVSDALLLGILQNMQRPAPSIDFPALTAAAAPIIAAVITVMGARKDPMETAVQVAALVKDNQPKAGGGSSITDMIALFREGMALGRRTGGDGDGDRGPGALEVAEKGLHVLEKFADGYINQQRTGPPAAVPGETAPMTRPALGPGNGTRRGWISELWPYRDAVMTLTTQMAPAAAAVELESRMSEESVNDLIDHFDASGTPTVFAADAVAQLGFPTDALPWIAEVGRLVRAEYEDEPPAIARASEPLATAVSAPAGKGGRKK